MTIEKLGHQLEVGDIIQVAGIDKWVEITNIGPAFEGPGISPLKVDVKGPDDLSTEWFYAGIMAPFTVWTPDPEEGRTLVITVTLDDDEICDHNVLIDRVVGAYMTMRISVAETGAPLTTWENPEYKRKED